MKASRTNSSRYCTAVTTLNLNLYRAYKDPGETDRVFLQTVDELRGDGAQKSH